MRPMWARAGFLCLLAMGWAGASPGATQVQIDLAIDRGLSWLLTQQQPDGSWSGTRPPGPTAICLAVLGHDAQRHRTTPLAGDYAYRTQMQAGLDFVFRSAFHDSVNQRVWFGNADMMLAENYPAGPSLMGIVLSGDSNRVVNTPGSPVNGLTYKQVAQRIVNFIAHVQISSGDGIGSWDYRPNSTQGDASVSGWNTLGLGYARDRFAVELPATLLDRISSGIGVMQQTANPASPDHGGAGYRSTYVPPYSAWVNTHKVGHLLYMMHLVGDDTNVVRVQHAVAYLQRHWSSPTDGGFGTPGWRGSPPALLPSYIGTATLTKGLVAMEIDELAGPLDWFDDMSTVIVNNQNAAGYWDQGGHPTGLSARNLSTAWALLSLMRATPLDPVLESWENITYTSGDFKVTSGLGGTGYYIVVPRDATAPTEAQIRAGVNYGGVTLVTSGNGPVTADVERVYSVTGLTAGTPYDLYFVVQAGDGTYGRLVKSPFTTKAYAVPEVNQTTAAGSITPGSATTGGNVSDSGGQPVTQRGVVWSTDPGPTLASHAGGGFTLNGTGIGSFTSLLTGLLPATTYYVRAYAVNAIGAGYGPMISVTTKDKLIDLLGKTILQFGWYARVSEFQLRCRFQFDDNLQPAGGPLRMRRLWLDTPSNETYTIYHYTNQTVFGSNVSFQLISYTGNGDDIPSDGDYTLHLEYADLSVTQTVFHFFIPGTTNPLPAPEQYPIIVLPPQGSSLTSPVDLEWEPVTDSNVTFVTLQSAGQIFVLPDTETQFGPVELPLGDQSLEVWFMHGYDGLYTEEGVPYQIGKGNSKVHTFEVYNDTEWNLNYSVGVGGTLVGDTAQVVPFGNDGTPVEAQPQLDAVFGGWTDGLVDNPRTELYVTNHINVTAWFQSPAGVPLDWYDDRGLVPGPGETWSDVDQGDEDEDESSNAGEYFADTNPLDIDDVLRIDDMIRFPSVMVEFTSSTNRLYRLRSTYDLETGFWSDIPGEVPRMGVGGPDSLEDPYAPTYPHHYRIEAELP